MFSKSLNLKKIKMNYKRIILSSSGLKNIVLNTGLTKDEFKFIFNDRSFSMKSIYAEFLSPAVCRLHQADPTINSIQYDNYFNEFSTLKFEDIFNDEIISLLHQISSGFSIEINEDQGFLLQIVSILMENEELFEKINENFQFNIQETNIDKYLENLNFFYSFTRKSKHFNYSKIIDNVASHFYSIHFEKLTKLPKSILYSIISNPHFKIESEDWLFDLINTIFKDGKNEDDENENYSIIEFYEKVEFSGLSENKFKFFLKNFDFNEMSNLLWHKLSQCFYFNYRSKDKRKKERYPPPLFEFDGKSEHYFKGIIHYLTEENGGNVDEKGVVKVTSSSTNNNYLAKYAVDLDDNQHYFQSHRQPDSWIKYDFKKRKIHPTFYSIRTRHDWGKCSCHPKNWVIEGSNTNNDSDWKILDERSEVTCLDDKNVTHAFEIQNSLSKKECFRYLRLRQTGFNTGDNYYLTLSALEFFGSIY